MDRYTRCTNCLTEIGSDSVSCHHCGEPRGPGRRRFLGKGALTFVLVWVLLFAVGDSVYLLNNRRIAFKRDDMGIMTADAWLKGWIDENDRLLRRHGSDGKAFKRALSRMRAKYEDVLPEDAIDFITITPRGTASSYPDPYRSDRIRRKDCRVFNFMAAGRHCSNTVEVSGRIWVRGRQGSGEVVHLEIEGTNEWPHGGQDSFRLQGNRGAVAISVK